MSREGGGKYRVFIKYYFFPRIHESLPPLPRQYSAAIGCTKNPQPIGVTVLSHCVECFEGLLYSDVGEGGITVNCEKTHFFLNIMFAFLTYPMFEGFMDLIG